MTTIAEAMKLSEDELARKGRFELRMLATAMGLLKTEEDKARLAALTNAALVAELYAGLCKLAATWQWQHWVRDLFEEMPELCSIYARKQHSMGYNHGISVMWNGNEYHRVLDSSEFRASYIIGEMECLCVSEVLPDSRWLDTMPIDIVDTVTRATFGIPEPVPVTTPAGYDQVILAHGMWMWTAFLRFRELTAIAKSANVAVSPNTFAFVRNAQADFSWMKCPDLQKIQHRMRTPTTTRRQNGKFIWETGVWTRGLWFVQDEVEQALIRLELVTETEVQAARQRQSLVSGTEEASKKSDATPSVQLCKCGSSLATTKAFKAKDGSLQCGECQVKAAGDHAWGDCALGPKAFPRVDKKRADPRFDPRPGIDDEGLGNSTPTWED